MVGGAFSNNQFSFSGGSANQLPVKRQHGQPGPSKQPKDWRKNRSFLCQGSWVTVRMKFMDVNTNSWYKTSARLEKTSRQVEKNNWGQHPFWFMSNASWWMKCHDLIVTNLGARSSKNRSQVVGLSGPLDFSRFLGFFMFDTLQSPLLFPTFPQWAVEWIQRYNSWRVGITLQKMFCKKELLAKFKHFFFLVLWFGFQVTNWHAVPWWHAFYGIQSSVAGRPNIRSM